MSLCRYLPAPSDRMGILWTLLSIEGSVILEYGPSGTTHFSMGLFGELGIDNENRLFTTHMSEDDVVMGDVTRLEKALLEIDEGFAPDVIFVVASSISAVIGTDLKGVCAYMQDKVNARLVAFEQGGFRGDYSAGIREAYRLLAVEIAESSSSREPGLYNLLGMSMGAYRARSDAWEMQSLLERAFDLHMHTSMCADTSITAIRSAGKAYINIVVRDEALPCARILEEKCGTPFIQGTPYGYSGTLDWLEQISNIIGKPVDPALAAELKRGTQEAQQYRMYAAMIKKYKPAATLVGEYHTIKGIAAFLGDAGIPASNIICQHTLRIIESHDVGATYLPEEKDRINLLKGLHNQLILGDDVSLSVCADDNTKIRISTPLVYGAQIARHMPFVGMRGADYLMEAIESYLTGGV